jgi:hypothetical protein
MNHDLIAAFRIVLECVRTFCLAVLTLCVLASACR